MCTSLMQYLRETEKSDNPLTKVMYSYELPHGYEKKTQAPWKTLVKTPVFLTLQIQKIIYLNETLLT